MAQQAPVGHSIPIIEASRSHSDTPHLVGLLWTSDQSDAETSTWRHTTTVTPVGFERAIPTSERPQTHALERRHRDRRIQAYISTK